MGNEIQKYDPQAFAAQRVYDRLTEPLEDLTPIQQINTIAVGVGNLRKTIDEVVEKLRDRAVDEQKKVVEEKDSNVQTVYSGLDKARKSNDFEMYDKVSADVIRAIMHAKGSVSDLRLLQAGDFNAYAKSQKLLTEGDSK